MRLFRSSCTPIAFALATVTLAAAVHADTPPSAAAPTPVHASASASDARTVLIRAREAIEAGELESAAAMLEGFLVEAGEEPALLLTLGALYLRMGAPTVAESYLSRAKRLAGGNRNIADTADGYLRSAAAETSRSRWSGFVLFGLRYQTNPSLSPESNEILAGGLRIALPDALDEQADTNAEVSSGIHHRYRLSPQVVLASDIDLYGTLYADDSSLNYGVIELTTGPAYERPAQEHRRWRVRPHAIGLVSYFDDAVDEKTLGLGIDFGFRHGPRSAVTATYQFRHRDFSDDAFIDGAARAGDEHRLDLDFAQEIVPGQVLGLRLLGRKMNAGRPWYEEEQLEATLRYLFRVRNLLFPDRPAMAVTPYALWRTTDYGGADPAIAPNLTRSDDEWRLGIVGSAPFAKDWALELRAEQAERNSNLPNYDASNTLVMVGVRRQF